MKKKLTALTLALALISTNAPYLVQAEGDLDPQTDEGTQTEGTAVEDETPAEEEAPVEEETPVVEETPTAIADTYTPKTNTFEWEDTANNYRLVFQDEFAGETLDSSKWGHQEGDGSDYGIPGWGNNELQIYQEDNTTITDGNLVISAKKDDEGNYTSSRIWSSEKFAATYGRFEANIALPAGDGMWPAFWLLPQDSPYGGWAAGGEIDIMEAMGTDTGHAAGTIHYGGEWPNNTYSGGSYEEEGFDFRDFHVYAIEWEPGEIRWYVDDELYHTETHWYATDSSDPNNYTFPAPFNNDFYIILNLAVGGWFDPNADLDKFVDGDMLVDYVRVYQKDKSVYDEMEDKVTSGGSVSGEDYPDGTAPGEDGVLSHTLSSTSDLNDCIGKAESEQSKTQWNLVGTGATATVTGGVVDVDITSAGSNTYDIQLIDYVPLVKGKNYQVSFEAKADATRSIVSQFGSGSDSGWTKFSNAFTSNLTTEYNEYSYAFTMMNDYVADSRLEINLGTNSSNVSIKNIVIKEVDEIPTGAAKTPLADGNHVYNGTFDKGSSYLSEWDYSSDVTVTDTYVGTGHEAIAIASIDTLYQANLPASTSTLSQSGLQQFSGDSYKLTFDATSTGTVTIKNADGTTQLTKSFVAGANTFEYNCTKDDTQATITFTADSTTKIDNVVLARTTNNNVDVDSINKSLVSNGGFENGLASWSTYSQGWDEGGSGVGAMTATIETVDGSNVFAGNITALGSDWNPLLHTEGMLPLTDGVEYTITFDAWTDNARDIMFILEDAGYTRHVEKTVSLTGESQTFTYTHTTAGTGSTELTAKFLLGQVNDKAKTGTVYIDNVIIYATDYYDPDTEWNPTEGTFDGTFDNGMGTWETYEAGGMTSSIVDGVFVAENTGDGEANWSNQLYCLVDSLTGAETYELTFEAWADKATVISVALEDYQDGQSYYSYLSDTINLTTTKQTYTITGTDGIWDCTHKLLFFLGAVEGASSGATVSIDNVQLSIAGTTPEVEDDTTGGTTTEDDLTDGDVEIVIPKDDEIPTITAPTFEDSELVLDNSLAFGSGDTYLSFLDKIVEALDISINSITDVIDKIVSSVSSANIDTITPLAMYTFDDGSSSSSSSGKVTIEINNVDTTKKLAVFGSPDKGKTWSKVAISSSNITTLGASATMSDIGIISNTSSISSDTATVSFTGQSGYTYMLSYVTTDTISSTSGGGYGNSTSSSSSSSSSGSSSSGGSSSNSTLVSTGAGYSYSGNVSVNGTYINELRGVLAGEMVNLTRITTVNGQEVLGWYYDPEFTRAVSNPETFVFTSDVISGGIYAKTTGSANSTLTDGSTNAGAGGVTSGAVTGSTSDNSATSNTITSNNTSYVPSTVPSTIAKILSKLF